MAAVNPLITSAQFQSKKFGRIQTRLNNKFKSNPVPTAGVLLRLKTEIEELRSIRTVVDENCDLIAANLETITDESQRQKAEEFAVNQSDVLRSAYTEILEKYENLRQKFEGKPKVQSDVPHAEVRPKLKDIDIPIFSGQIRKFMEYKGVFEALVHNNPQYTNPEKMHFLKQSLRGEAEKLLSDSAAGSMSYPEAWSLVCEWFQNTQMIVNFLFADLFATKRVKDQSSVRSLVLEIDSILRGLKSAGQQPENWGSILQYFVSSKLDDETRRDWQNSRADSTDYPQYSELKTFLISRIHAAEAIPSNQTTKPRPVPQSSQQPNINAKPYSPTHLRKFSAVISKTCICCQKASHLLIECGKFKSLSPLSRYELVQKSRLCLNCFNSNHVVADCPKPSCKICKFRHNTLLHFENRKPVDKGADFAVNYNKSDSAENPASQVCSTVQVPNKFVLLPTAVVQFSCGNVTGFLRVMFDCASQPTLISDALVRKYKLRVYKSVSSISGLGSSFDSSFSCSLKLRSRVSRFDIDIDADVVPASAISYSVPDKLPFTSSRDNLNIQLAEKSVGYNTVDLILGNEYYDRCVLESTTVFENVLFKNTRFGWTPSGPVAKQSSCNVVCAFVSTKQIHEDLKRFWEIEEVVPSKVNESEHALCERHFEKTYRRADDGRFIVRLPLATSPSVLGESRSRALRSLIYSEKNSVPAVRDLYVRFLEEYEQLGHMSLVTQTSTSPSSPSYYINHHAVLRPSSTTTKLRVVFNASAPTVRGPSLNSILMNGPKLQPDLIDILLSFRMFAVAFSADIEKMYRQITVDKSDRHLQRILWRPNTDQPVREYELNTLTYGTVPASFIAIKCLDVVAETVEKKFPVAAHAIRNCFYMDDLLCSCPTVDEAIALQRTIHEELMKAKFPLRKYVSNNAQFLKEVDSSLVESVAVDFSSNSATQILGLIWEPSRDLFHIKINLTELNLASVITKRIVLAWSARIFDPLGFVSPVTIRFKILLQSIWKEAKGWDDPVTEANRKTFAALIEELKELKAMTIRRPFSTLPIFKSQLIGFCDASALAYCASVYLKATSCDKTTEAYLVCAKTKVAPIPKGKISPAGDKITIHQLELSAAVLLARLLQRVSSSLRLNLANVDAYSDSQVTLCWLAKPPETWNQFVRNRVAIIQAIVPFSRWRYVRSVENPADLATRGISVPQLLASRLWLNGPNFILKPSNHPFEMDESTVPISSCNTLCSTVVAVSEPSMFSSFSSFARLQNVTARILRLTKKTRSSTESTSPADLSHDELTYSFFALIKHSQKLAFPEEISLLREKKPINRRSKLWFLQPVLDQADILRVSGRLENAPVSFDTRHPIILSSKSPFVNLYLKHVHNKYFHAGSNFITAFLHSRFRFVGGINSLAKSIIRRCVICARFNRRPQNQLMAQLPTDRVTISPPFTKVIVDFAGPFDTKCVGHRSTIRFKSYLCVFVCLTTRAVHFEVTSSLETEHFLRAFERFSARRGVPTKIYSDNGTTFVKARKSLKIQWEFGPPYGPHHQGLVEAAVKSAKRCLLKVTKNRTLSFEEYNTLFSRIEAVLNSRPLCRHKDSFLTPGHFLIGRHLLIPSDLQPADADIPMSQRIHIIEKLTRDFWISWSKTYLNDLNNRTRWLKKKPNVKIGDIVLVSHPNSKPADWPLAVVTAVQPSDDNLVRRVAVRFGGKITERPITRLILLPIENSSSEPSPGTV